MSKIILGYWDYRGVAEPIRYLLHYKKVDFEDKRYTADVLGYEEWQMDKFNLGLDFPNLPFYIEGDFKLTQNRAIIRYIGYTLGLIGKTSGEYRRAILADQQCVDFRQKLKNFVEGDEYEKIGKEEFLKSVQPMFQQWETFLGDRKFMIADHITYIDFVVYEALDLYRLYHETILVNYPSLKAYFNIMRNLPELQGYINSPIRKPWPIFGPSAKFGGGGDPPNHL